ncbi:unnamed protein product [Calypogeia fissa]
MAVQVHSPLFICSEAYELLLDIAIIAKRELQDIYEDQLLLSAAWDFLIESANSSALVASTGIVDGESRPSVHWREGLHTHHSLDVGAQSEDLTTGVEKFRLKDEHYDMMVSYLEVPEIFSAISGGWKKTKVGAKYQKRVVVMKQFHAAISEFGFPKDISIPNFTKRPNVALEIEADVGVNDADYVYPQGATNPVAVGRPALEDLGGSIEPTGGAETNLDELEGSDENDLLHLENVENANPNIIPQRSPTIVLSDSTASRAQSFHTAPMAPTPDTIRAMKISDRMWNELEVLAGQPLPEHANSCQCATCRAFLGVHTGESRLVPTTTATRVASPQNSSPLTPQAPQKKGDKAAKNGDKQGLPRPTLPKPGLEKKKEALAPPKPSFANIYADKINLKSDYRKELIQSRDKWKTEDLAERREARAEDLAERREARAEASWQRKQDREHQFELERITAENSIKKAKADQDHALQLAKAIRKTTLLNTLLQAGASADHIRLLLPIIEEKDEN